MQRDHVSLIESRTVLEMSDDHVSLTNTGAPSYHQGDSLDLSFHGELTADQAIQHALQLIHLGDDTIRETEGIALVTEDVRDAFKAERSEMRAFGFQILPILFAAEAFLLLITLGSGSSTVSKILSSSVGLFVTFYFLRILVREFLTEDFLSYLLARIRVITDHELNELLKNNKVKIVAKLNSGRPYAKAIFKDYKENFADAKYQDYIWLNPFGKTLGHMFMGILDAMIFCQLIAFGLALACIDEDTCVI
jgi:hypothetical protein